MVGEFDSAAPTLQVNVYEDGALVAKVPCESSAEAADVAAEWEERDGFRCEVEDLAVRHGADDILAPETDDLRSALDEGSIA